MSAGALATTLDREMLDFHAVKIAPPSTAKAALPLKSGLAVSNELGGRLLIRYLLPNQVAAFTAGSGLEHFATPTPLAPNETNSVLALPAPRQRRAYALLLDPKAIPEALGPRWVRFGTGIEYILPAGFPAAAVASRWALRVT